MASIIGYGFFEDLAKAIYKITGYQISEKVTAIVFLSVLGITLLIVFYKNILKPIIRNHKWRRKQLDEIFRGYGNYTSRRQRWLYIDTILQTDAPNDLDEPSQAQFQDLRTNTKAIKFFLKQVLRKDNSHSPFYCILGGSGMGKSTFVVNLIWRYIKKYKEKSLPYPVRLINCGDVDDLAKCIEKIENQGNTILILDALDENNKAIDDYRQFYLDLLSNITKFRIVIITCRTQFFEKYEDEPSLLPGHEPSTKKPREFKKYYVSPFKTEEVAHYLNKKYLFRFSKKKKAKAIVKNCNQLMARPLLLSYIDDLLSTNIDKNNYSIARIYEIIIDKWLEREADFAVADNKKDEYKETLLAFSIEIALCLARPSSIKTQSGVLIDNELPIDHIIEQYKDKQIVKAKNLKGRSLLNRNSKNEYKFAHKSFMEFLVAKQIYANKDVPIESIDFISNDMIMKFLVDMFSKMRFEDRSGVFTITLSSTIKWNYTNANTGINNKYRFLNRSDYLSLPYEVRIGYRIQPENIIQIGCNVTDTVLAFLLGLMHCFEERISRIDINCNFEYAKITTLLNEFAQNSSCNNFQLGFRNYDFRDETMVDILRPVLNTKLNLIDFYIMNKTVFDTGSIDILKFLTQAQLSIPRIPISITIRVYYFQHDRYVEYKRAFENQFILDELQR